MMHNDPDRADTNPVAGTYVPPAELQVSFVVELDDLKLSDSMTLRFSLLHSSHQST